MMRLARRLSSASSARLSALRLRLAQEGVATQNSFRAPPVALSAANEKWVAPQLQVQHDPHMLDDSFNRRHNYLRISLTERCSLRCVYCMPPEGVALTKKEHLLQPAEMLRLVSLLVSAGVNKVRLTGGEPTVRSDLVQVVDGLNAMRPHGLQQICMTTNGVVLTRSLAQLQSAGLDKINISLDTLDRKKFAKLTRFDALPKVLAAIDSAISLGFSPLKINCVVMRNTNDDEVMDFARLSLERPVDVRFIEYMPFDDNGWSQDLMVPSSVLLKRLQEDMPGMQRVATDRHDVATTWAYPGAPGSVSFISSMSQPFCGGCNRMRLTADGALKVCLFGTSEVSLRDAMRENATDSELLQMVHLALARKHARHAGMHSIASQKNRPMTTIGG